MTLPTPSSQPPSDSKYLTIGRVSNTHGIHGFVRVEILTDFPERFQKLRRVFVGDEHEPVRVRSAKLDRGHVLLKLYGYEDVTAAAELKGKYLAVPIAEAVELPDGQYFWHQIVGLDVVTTAGESLGTVAEILATGANDVYIVKGPRGEILVPVIEDVVKEVDLAGGRLIVEPLPGLW
ncbi:MAG: 16S rRNA processing protein RimM [Chloroflexi bacterium]|nr:16S rRNA processing protein RimM [Chloroflexota bacterium]